MDKEGVLEEGRKMCDMGLPVVPVLLRLDDWAIRGEKHLISKHAPGMTYGY
jgi:hypothetical protein